MATASKNIVGPQVRRLRVASGMSQAAFAASCQRGGWDVGRAVLAKIECGIRCVEDHELLELAKALRCPVADLYPARVQAVIRGKKSAS
jgi:transcriptional regulator with XRE-family HTH domain